MADTPTLETYSIKVSPLDAPDVWRVVELRANQKLRELHATIAAEFGLDASAPWRFFLTNRPWDRAGEYAHDGRARQHTLAQLALRAGLGFLHVAQETTERWNRCEVTAVGTAAPGEKYPRVTERHGEPPDPFDDIEMLFTGGAAADEDEDGPANDEEEPAPTEADRALFERAVAAAREYDAHFEREDAAQAPRAREAVARDLPLARELCAQFGGPRLGVFDALLDEADDAPVAEWLDMLVFDLEDHGMRDEAIALCDVLSDLLDPAEVASNRALLLQRAGRNDEAVAAAEALLTKYPADLDVRTQAASVLRHAGRLERAEDLARSVLAADLEDEDVLHYKDAIETLGEVLRATGRAEEAEQLAHSEQAERVVQFEAMAAEYEDEAGDGAGDALAAVESLLESAVRAAPPRTGRKEPK